MNVDLSTRTGSLKLANINKPIVPSRNLTNIKHQDSYNTQNLILNKDFDEYSQEHGQSEMF